VAALACGADDFVAKPVTPQELSDKITEMLDRPAKKARGRVITLLSLRGGVGVTTIATNLASALRLQLGPNITLVDLSPNSGHVALQLKIQPQRTWLRLLQQPDLNSDLVRSLLTNHSVGLNLLAAPVAPTMNASLTEGQVAAIASILSDGAEYVIIDAPPTLSAMCVGALRASDLVLLVLTPDVASVQTAAGTLHALVELGISGKRIHLLLNHPASQPGLSKQAVEHGLRRTVTFSVPFDAYQPRALAQGKPLALEDTVSPLPDAVRKIATALVKPI
jgi:pilus assembly protein CpaE